MKRKQEIEKVMRTLRRDLRIFQPPAVSEIAKRNRHKPFPVLIATILSPQTRDTVTEQAARRLLARAGTPQALAKLPTATIEKLIYPVSFYRAKARHVKETARLIATKYKGKVPKTRGELMILPGVGRKVANLVLGLCFGQDAICVDTHVHKIANRLGWVRTKTPEQTEFTLMKILPRRYWTVINEYFVTYGQNVRYPKTGHFCSDCMLKLWRAKISQKSSSAGTKRASGTSRGGRRLTHTASSSRR
jgi:endonuclease-3